MNCLKCLHLSMCIFRNWKFHAMPSVGFPGGRVYFLLFEFEAPGISAAELREKPEKKHLN